MTRFSDAPVPETATPPAIKVGALVMRRHAGALQFLLVQPHPKHPDDMPPMGLPRGTRMYFDPASGQPVDADHDGTTLPATPVRFEAVEETMRRELQEEAGVTDALLQRAQVVDHGAPLFHSVRKGVYPLHWFSVMLHSADAAALPHEGLKDSLYSRWVGYDELIALVQEGRVSPGYVTVVDTILSQLEPVEQAVADGEPATRARPAQNPRDTGSRSR